MRTAGAKKGSPPGLVWIWKAGDTCPSACGGAKLERKSARARLQTESQSCILQRLLVFCNLMALRFEPLRMSAHQVRRPSSVNRAQVNKAAHIVSATLTSSLRAPLCLAGLAASINRPALLASAKSLFERRNRALNSKCAQNVCSPEETASERKSAGEKLIKKRKLGTLAAALSLLCLCACAAT